MSTSVWPCRLFRVTKFQPPWKTSGPIFFQEKSPSPSASWVSAIRITIIIRLVQVSPWFSMELEISTMHFSNMLWGGKLTFSSSSILTYTFQMGTGASLDIGLWPVKSEQMTAFNGEIDSVFGWIFPWWSFQYSWRWNKFSDWVYWLTK